MVILLLILVMFMAVFLYSRASQIMGCGSASCVCKVLLQHSNGRSFVHCLCVVFDYFCVTVAELNDYGRDLMAHKV